MHPFPRICSWSTSFQSDVSIMTSIVSTSTFPDAGITSSSRSPVRVIWWIKMPTTNTNRSDTIPSMKGRVLTWKAPRFRCIIPRVNWLTSWPQILILLLTSFLLLLQCSSSSYSLCNRFVKSSLSEISIEAPKNVAILWICFVCLHLYLHEEGTKKVPLTFLKLSITDNKAGALYVQGVRVFISPQHRLCLRCHASHKTWSLNAGAAIIVLMMTRAILTLNWQQRI